MDTILNRKKRVAELCTPQPLDENDIDTSHLLNDSIFNMLYEPQANGLPDLSLGLVFSGKARPEISQYVDNMLLQNSQPGQYVSPDEALEFTPRSDLQFGREREVYMSYVSKHFYVYLHNHQIV